MARRIIVAGSRSFGSLDRPEVWRILGWHVRHGTTIVSGHAQGIDRLGEQFYHHQRSLENGYDCDLELYPADWARGRRAGHERNARMAEVGHVLVAVWDGRSRGTRDMIAQALARGLEVHVYVREPRGEPAPLRLVGI